MRLTLCLPKKFHANCTIGVRWTPNFKKGCGHKNLAQINNLTLKSVINEQLNTKTSNKRKKKYKNALIKSSYILYSARQGVQRLDGGLLSSLHRFLTVAPLFACLWKFCC